MQRKECDPVITGLFPILSFILGTVICATTHKVNNHILDENDWVCTKFDEGECVQYTDKSVKPEKTMKNS